MILTVFNEYGSMDVVVVSDKKLEVREQVLLRCVGGIGRAS